MPKKSKQILIETPKTDVLTLEQILESQNTREMDIAKILFEIGAYERVHLDPRKQENMQIQDPSIMPLLGLGSAYHKSRRIIEHLCKKFPNDSRHVINQILRMKDDNGAEWLYVQGITYSRDLVGNKVTSVFNLGRIEKPVIYTHYEGFDSRTGQPINSGKEIQRLETEHYIKFSPEQLAALKPAFGKKMSFIIHTGSRKYTLEDVDEFCLPFSELKAKLSTPVKKV